MDYRREIDGLRAIAVVPVILFHAGFETFRGGFVGVDIFFVISGYLITTIIFTELQQEKFSIISFYERRARRILPALFLVMLVSIPFAWFWLPASDMKDFSKSLAAVSIFSSNFLFWRDSGYFDTATELKPLLHTWSLAVEEQYYVLFPLFLILFSKLAKRWIFIVLGLVFCASFAISEWSAHAKPAAAFYLLTSRSWELLVGAFAAFYLLQNDRKECNKYLNELGGWLGFGLIFHAVFSYSKATPFPGFYALVPTMGTVLVILFATRQTIVGKFLGNNAFVSLGLISYSAYLWHQPIFAFARHAHAVDSHSAMFSLSLFSIAIGYISWRYFETPFRSINRFNQNLIFKLAFLGSIFFIGIGYYGNLKNGFPQYPVDIASENTKITNRNFIVLGDSHADDLRSGLLSSTAGHVTNYTSNGCIPFRNVDRYDSRYIKGECVKKINSWLDEIILNDPDAIVVISSMGPIYLDGVSSIENDPRTIGLGVELITDKTVTDRYKIFEIGLRQTLLELSNLKRASIVFVVDIPELGIERGCTTLGKQLSIGNLIIKDLVKEFDPLDCYVLRSEYDARVSSYKKLVFNILSEHPKVHLFDPTDIFCNDVLCKGYDSKFGFLYRDIDHLSDSGRRFYAEAMIKFLRQ
jgi:peptidoglycan/LPS O-acetylase OafA/YrhL